MAKWTVTLTVIASCIFSVLSQTDISSWPTIAESPDTEKDEVPTGLKIQLDTSTFPPLIHGNDSEEVSSGDPIQSRMGDTKLPDTKHPATHGYVITSNTVTETIVVNPQNNGSTNISSTTDKPNSSDILQGSLLLSITVGVLVCKFGF